MSRPRILLAVIAGVSVTAAVQHFASVPLWMLTDKVTDSPRLSDLIVYVGIALPGIFIAASVAAGQRSSPKPIRKDLPDE